MTGESQDNARYELAKLEGALDLLFELRELYAQWVEEAQDDSKLEALENVLGHIEAVETEYKHRHDELQGQLNKA